MFVLFSYCAECRYIFYKMQSQLSPNQLRNTRLCSIHLHDSCVQRLVVPCLPYPSTLLYTGCCSEVKDIVYLCGEASWGHAPYYSSLWGRRLRCVGWGGRHTGQSGKLARSRSLSLSGHEHSRQVFVLQVWQLTSEPSHPTLLFNIQ